VERSDRLIFILSAIEAITGGMMPLSYADLSELNKNDIEKIEDMICKLFLNRPFMTPHLALSKLSQSFEYIEVHLKTLSEYLKGYGRIEFN